MDLYCIILGYPNPISSCLRPLYMKVIYPLTPRCLDIYKKFIMKVISHQGTFTTWSKKRSLISTMIPPF